MGLSNSTAFYVRFHESICLFRSKMYRFLFPFACAPSLFLSGNIVLPCKEGENDDHYFPFFRKSLTMHSDLFLKKMARLMNGCWLVFIPVFASKQEFNKGGSLFGRYSSWTGGIENAIKHKTIEPIG